MSDVDLDSYELLFSQDGHRTYQLCPGALLSIHDGDMTDVVMRPLLETLDTIDGPVVAYVADLAALGRVTKQARRVAADHPNRIGVEGVMGRVYLVNASVFARAAGTMLLAVSRFSSRRETDLLFRKTLPQAIDEAMAFARETLERLER